MATPQLPPRKVKVATFLAPRLGPWASLGQRGAELAAGLRDVAAASPGIDLVVFPESVLTAGRPGLLRERALSLAEVGELLADLASLCGGYLVLPFELREEDRVANAAVLVDRQGKIAGIYRKAHPVAALGESCLEGGVTPGREFPVFDCDFGRLGIQICWDMSYEDGWAELARQGAELIVLPSASPQTIRPAAQAMRHRVYIVSSTPRDNASVFNPVGLIEAQRTTPGLLVHTLDLSHAVLHWSEGLEEGRALTRRFGNRVGYIYSSREDTGIFWSNDPSTPIGAMLRELGLETMDEQVERCRLMREG